MNHVKIRRATRRDVPEIVRILADDPLGRLRERDERPLPECYYEAFAEIAEDPRSELIVAESDGAVVGTLQLTFVRSLSLQGGRRALVEAVFVDSRFRGRGIGGRMLEWAIGRAREKGCQLIQLTSHKSRTEAHRFYERLGFIASHEGMKLTL